MKTKHSPYQGFQRGHKVPWKAGDVVIVVLATLFALGVGFAIAVPIILKTELTSQAIDYLERH